MADSEIASWGTAGGPTPEITVILTSFGRRQFLLEALRSATEQTIDRSRSELVVVKDFEDAEIDAAIARVGATGVRADGTAHGRWLTQALDRARGRVLVFLDDDDRFLPEKLATVLGEFSTDSTLSYYHNGMKLIGGDVRNGVGEATDGGRASNRVRLGPGERSWEVTDKLWRSQAAFNLSSIATLRSVLESSLPFLRHVELASSAFLYYAALTGTGTLVNDPAVLTEYRVHPNNASGSYARDAAGRWEREVERSPRLANDCRVILAMLAARHTSRAVALPVRVELRRNLLLAAIGAPSSSRARIAVESVRLVAASFPGYLARSGPHLQLALRALREPTSRPHSPSARDGTGERPW